MTVDDDFLKLQSQFGQFQQHLDSIQNRLPPDDVHVGQIQNIKKMLAAKYQEFVQVFQAENARLDQEMAAVKSRMAATKQAATAAQAAREQAQAAIPVPAESGVPDDPDLGKKLRATILREFMARPKSPATAIGGDVTGMDSSAWKYDATASAAPQPAPSEPTPRRTPRKPRVGGESFEWESTGEWER